MLLHRSLVAALIAASVLGTAAAAAAQSAPESTATPMPREKFVVIDGGVTTKVLDQLSPGNYGSSFGLMAGAEYPILGHSFDAVFDYAEYGYPHPSDNAQPNGLQAACTTPGDPGCVTPIGFASYPAGTTQYVNAFNAQDTAEQFTIGDKISRNTRLYVETGWNWRSFNYTSMPPLSGWGLGLDMLPNLDKPFALYGGFWIYGDMHGSYSAAAPGPFLVDYRLYTYRLGATYTVPNTPLFADLNWNGDRLDGRNRNDPSDIVHTALWVGIGAHI